MCVGENGVAARPLIRLKGTAGSQMKSYFVSGKCAGAQDQVVRDFH